MNAGPVVKVYDSLSEDYHHAFQVFLDHTDQKVKAREWLDRLVDSLLQRRVFIDAGAGTGKVTAWFVDKFTQTIGIEPNPSLSEELRQTCPAIKIISKTIQGAKPAAKADLVLCSHVLYYIDPAEWQDHLAEMASWLAPGGVLVIVLQNSNTECMDMLNHFHKQRFDLSAAARQFQSNSGDRYQVSIERVPAYVTTDDLESAVIIAEFMLNLLPMPRPPKRKILEEYVAGHFANPAGGFRFSCHQDFVSVRSSANG